MKKVGFTLAEVLIALAIAGIVAAITLNGVRSIVPDKDKVLVLKTYKIITDVNEEILSNKRWTAYGDDDCDALECINGVKNSNYFTANQTYDDILIDSIAKSFPYPAIFARHLHLKDDKISNELGAVEFVTVDGNRWSIYTLNDGEYTVTLDFGDSKKSQCTYNKTSCTKPAWFSYYVDKKGHVFGNDPLTTAFMANTEKINDAKDDYKEASNDNTSYKTIKMKVNKK